MVSNCEFIYLSEVEFAYNKINLFECIQFNELCFSKDFIGKSGKGNR